MIESTYLKSRELASEELKSTDDLARELGFDPAEINKEEQQKPEPFISTPATTGESPTASGAGKGIAKTAETAVNILPDVGNAVMDGLNKFDGWLQSKGYTHQDLISNDFRFPRLDLGIEGKVKKNERMGYALGQALAQVASFGTVSAARGVKTGIAVGGAVAAAVQDPKGPRLSDSLKDLPIVGPVAELLASKPDDSEVVGRVKNAIEGMTLDTGLTLATLGVLSGMRKLKPVEEAVVGGEQAAIKAETQAAPEALTPPKIEPGSPKQISIELPDTYKSPLAGKDPDALLSDIRSIRSQGPDQVLSNIEPAARQGAPVDVQLAAQQGTQATINQELRSRSGTTIDQTLVAAAELHSNTEKFQALLNRPVGSGYSAEEITALGFEVESASEKLMQSANAIVEARSSGKPITDEMLSAYKQMADYFPYTREVFEGAMSESGRALNIKNYVFGSGMNKQLMSEYIQLHGGSAAIEDQAAMLADIASKKGSEGINQVAKELTKQATWGQAVYEVFVQNALSPLSAIKIASSNIAQQSIGIIERHIAPSFARARGETQLADQMSAAAWDATKATLRESVAEVTSGLETFAESMVAFAKDTFSSGPVSAYDKLSRKATEGFRFDYRKTPAMSSEALGIENRIGASLVDLWGATSRLGVSPVSMADRISDAVAFKGQGTYLARLKGMEKGLVGEELTKYVDTMLASSPIRPQIPTARTAEAMQAYSAELNLFKEKQEIWSGISDYRNAVKFQGTPTTGWGKHVYEAINESDISVMGVPVLKAVSPFVRNNVNMAQAAFDSIPFLRGISPRNKAILQGGGREADLLMSRYKIYNTLMALGAAGGVSGMLSGQGSLNTDVRRSQQERGVLPYSFGNVARYRDLGIAGSIMGLGADIGVLAQYIGTGIMDPKWEASVADASVYLAASLADKVVIDDVVADFWSGMRQDSLKDIMRSAPANLQRQLVTTGLPAAGALTFIRNQMDPYKRVTKVGEVELAGLRNIVLDLANRLPGVSNNLPPALDTLGYPIEHNKGFIRNVTDFDDNLVEKNKTLKGLIALGMAGALVDPHPQDGETTMAIRPMDKSLRFRGTSDEIPLSPTQYNDMVLMSLGKESPGDKGEIEGRIQNVLDGNKPDEIKRILIKKIVAAGRQAARGKMLSKYPEIMAKYRELIRQRSGALKGDSSDFAEEE